MLGTRRLLSRLEHPAVGLCRHRQDARCEPFRQRAPARAANAACSSCSRKVPPRSAATSRSVGIDLQTLGRCRPAAFRGGAAQPVRLGDASGAHAPRPRPVPAVRRGRSTRSRRFAARPRKSIGAAAHGGHAEKPRHHGDVHQPAAAAPRGLEGTDEGLSSLMDQLDQADERRGATASATAFCTSSSRAASSHSNQVREYRMTDTGIGMIDAYVGTAGVLTGTARLAQEAREQAASKRRRAGSRPAQARRSSGGARPLERQIADLQAALEGEEEEVRHAARRGRGKREVRWGSNADLLADRRGGKAA